MERETYKEYILEQVWTLKDENNTYFGHKPIKIFYKGKGTRIAISEYNK